MRRARMRKGEFSAELRSALRHGGAKKRRRFPAGVSCRLEAVLIAMFCDEAGDQFSVQVGGLAEVNNPLVAHSG